MTIFYILIPLLVLAGLVYAWLKHFPKLQTRR
jgi:hypothetical protein